MDQDHFSRIVADKKRRRKETTQRLGDIIGQIFSEKMNPRKTGGVSVVALWGQLLPEGLAEHCKIDRISSGVIEVAADSSAYAYELRICLPELLKEIRKKCPRARIKEVNIRLR